MFYRIDKRDQGGLGWQALRWYVHLPAYLRIQDVYLNVRCADLQKGWKHVLEHYPEVSLSIIRHARSHLNYTSLTLTVLSLPVRATAVTPSSMYFVPIPEGCRCLLCLSWIQGHPEFGFNFKALVCHDGVRVFNDSRKA